jgi:hypothetical protein
VLILIASVGGSAAPIASAIAAKRPEFVLFLASEPQAGRPGSIAEIPGILEKAQRPKQTHQIVCLDDPDDPEVAFLRLREEIMRLRGAHPNARFLFDYTGGTKSMTSAVFQAALAFPGSAVQFMAGRREDLEKVSPGSERPARIPIDWLLAERIEARLREAWRSFDYATAARGCRTLGDDLGADEKAPPETRRRLADLAAASEAFDLWDRFRHSEAAAGLDDLAARLPKLAPFAALARACALHETERLLDLRRNAERCAARGRYDDAVARLYRLTEWIAQWRLAARHGLDASAMDWARVPQNAIARAGLGEQVGKKSLSGCVQAWKLVAALEQGGMVEAFLSGRFPHKDPKKTGEGRLRDVLDLRNNSILAHGARPLDDADWERWQAFAEVLHSKVLLPLLRDAGEAAELPRQLPKDPAALGL